MKIHDRHKPKTDRHTRKSDLGTGWLADKQIE